MENPEPMVFGSMGIDRSTDDILVIGFAENDDGSGAALIIQRQFKPLGNEPSSDYALSNHLGATVYGGVQAWILEGSRLTLRLAPETSRSLGLASRVVLELPVDRSQLAALRRALNLVLGRSVGEDTEPKRRR